ncbi:MAG: C40 family peptidase [Lachnospiraceae bacterium]|nr:C40 family peptidase [Lachnospiraceae bacterium]
MGKRSLFRRSLTLFATLLILSDGPVYVRAATTLDQIRSQKQEAEKQKNKAEKNLGSVNRDIENISEEQEALEAELEELDAQLVDLLLSVDILESDISDKEQDIEDTKIELEKAKDQVAAQESAMVRRIKFMYEQGSSTYLELFLESKSMAEAVNKTEYSEKLYKYDRLMLERYRIARQEVEDKEFQLESELSELEEIKEDLESQKEELNALIEEKQESVENFSEQLSKARTKAGEYKNQINAQTENLKKLNREEADKLAEEARKKAEEEARRKAEEAARKKAEGDTKKNNGELVTTDGKSSDSGTSVTSDTQDGTASEGKSTTTAVTATIEGEQTTSETKTETKTTGTTVTATGSGTGTDIANYALQFVGGPYVAGGTSLTNGCDCSGFTQSVFSNFGIKLPRNSYDQSQGGTEVTIDQAQAGDIVYYGGHVAIYIGNDQIVHASTTATGIKISSVFYRSIITIRRYY